MAVDELNEKSTMPQINKAISTTIKKLMGEGKSQVDAAGQAYGMAREKTGKELDHGR